MTIKPIRILKTGSYKYKRSEFAPEQQKLLFTDNQDETELSYTEETLNDPELLQRLKGLKVQMEHNVDAPKVGEIMDAFYTRDGVYVLADITDKHVLEDIDKLKLRSASLSHTAKVDDNKYLKIEPLHLALTNSPRIKQAMIFNNSEPTTDKKEDAKVEETKAPVNSNEHKAEEVAPLKSADDKQKEEQAKQAQKQEETNRVSQDEILFSIINNHPDIVKYKGNYIEYLKSEESPFDISDLDINKLSKKDIQSILLVKPKFTKVKEQTAQSVHLPPTKSQQKPKKHICRIN